MTMRRVDRLRAEVQRLIDLARSCDPDFRRKFIELATEVQLTVDELHDVELHDDEDEALAGSASG